MRILNLLCRKQFDIITHVSQQFSALVENKNIVAKRTKFLKNDLIFDRGNMKLPSVINTIEKIFPKHLSETWDNTGLLLEPQVVFPPKEISTVFLTNDLTESVMEEALAAHSDLILSYHPPLFTPIKALVAKNWKDRIVMQCIANNIALYSPHTSCDAIEGGVNDWLIRCFDLLNVKPIKPAVQKSFVVIEFITAKDMELNTALELNFETIETCAYNESKIRMRISVEQQLRDVALCKLGTLSDLQILTVTDCYEKNGPSSNGMGRIGTLRKPLKLSDCIKIIKEHTKLQNIRVAIGHQNSLNTEVSTIAACAGSGSSVLKNVVADLYITGEMSHHDILDYHSKRKCLILCEHSNSERGYLSDLAQLLQQQLDNVKVVVSSVDKDPISIL